MDKKILLIPDQPYWALDKNAKDLVKYNTSNLQLEICYFDDFLKDWKSYYEKYDLLFPMYMGLFFSTLERKIPAEKMITGIRSFHRWDSKKTHPPGYNTGPPNKIIRKLKKALLINTHCRKLWTIFSLYLPIIHTKYTCDLRTFYPEKQQRKTNKLIVGWTGSLTNHGKKRGFYEYIQPICNEIPEIELKVQAKEDQFITDDNMMRQFYNSLDVYVCASRVEGTPRPVIEAAACGVPIISTDVGIIPELVQDGINGLVVKRNYQAIKEGFLTLVGMRDTLPKMGETIRKKMEKEFNWEHLIYQWIEFFQNALDRYDLKQQGLI